MESLTEHEQSLLNVISGKQCKRCQRPFTIDNSEFVGVAGEFLQVQHTERFCMHITNIPAVDAVHQVDQFIESQKPIESGVSHE